MYGIRKSAEQRRSADHNRYDADNRVIGDDFAKLELRDNEGMLDAPCMQTAANKSQDLARDRRVVQTRTPTSSSPHRYPHPRAAPLTKSMPSTVTHHPTTRAARATTRAARAVRTNPEDTERLKNAAQNSPGPTTGKLRPAERSGSVSQKDATMEALLKEAK